MQVAPKGKWFIKCTDRLNGNVTYPFYDGFSTKREANSICDKLNGCTPDRYQHEVVKK